MLVLVPLNCVLSYACAKRIAWLETSSLAQSPPGKEICKMCFN